MRGSILCAAFSALSLMGTAHAAEELLAFRLECNNGVFTPKTLRVPAGKKFRIDLFNTGKEAIEFESKPLRKEKSLSPGGTSFVVIFPLDPGTYSFFDDFHIQAGPGTIIAQ